jgi:hypothetical protein
LIALYHNNTKNNFIFFWWGEGDQDRVVFPFFFPIGKYCNLSLLPPQYDVKLIIVTPSYNVCGKYVPLCPPSLQINTPAYQCHVWQILTLAANNVVAFDLKKKPHINLHSKQRICYPTAQEITGVS